MVAPWPSVVARWGGGWRALRPTISGGSELKSKRGSRGPHQEVLRAMAHTGSWRAVEWTLPLLSVMVGGSSKGPFQLGLHQTVVAQRRQARQAVIVAQNTVERRHYAWERWLWLSSDFARILHEGLPIYRGFAPRSCVARIRPRIYLQSEFELDVSWDSMDFLAGDERSGLVTPP
jgi:hypothetical protein